MANQLEFSTLISDFMAQLGLGSVEIYNEFSLQHELGIKLRNAALAGWKIQFERNISFFGIESAGFIKKEIDIVVYNSAEKRAYALELKYPTHGQYPEQMFKCCQDICFLEQLVTKGFSAGYFVIVADDHNFYQGTIPGPIYSHFRASQTIHGRIQKPTGSKDEFVDIRGSYQIVWKTISSPSKTKFALVSVERQIRPSQAGGSIGK